MWPRCRPSAVGDLPRRVSVAAAVFRCVGWRSAALLHAVVLRCLLWCLPLLLDARLHGGPPKKSRGWIEGQGGGMEE